MKAGIYSGKEQIKIRELPLPAVGDRDVPVQKLYSSVCETAVAVFTHDPNTGHKVTVGGEFRRETVANVDCWLDTAGAESTLADFLRLGKIRSRFVSVAANNKPRTIVLPHMTYALQSIIGSGGYMPEDVQEMMTSDKWGLERIITHEFPLAELEQAIRTAGDVDHAGNVVVEMK